MPTAKTRSELETEVFQLSNICGNLAKENALLRVRVETGGLETLRETIVALQEQLTELKEKLTEKTKAHEELSKELDLTRDAEVELDERCAKLEAASDPDAISVEVHEFMRAEGLLPTHLDTPIKIAPSHYVTGLYEAIQKAANE